MQPRRVAAAWRYRTHCDQIAALVTIRLRGTDTGRGMQRLMNIADQMQEPHEVI